MQVQGPPDGVNPGDAREFASWADPPFNRRDRGGRLGGSVQARGSDPDYRGVQGNPRQREGQHERRV